MYVLIFSTTFVWNIFHRKWNMIKMYTRAHVVTCYSCHILIKTRFFQHICDKYTYQILKNPSSGSRVVPCGPQTETHMTKLTIAFRNFANAPKKLQQPQLNLLQFFCHPTSTRRCMINLVPKASGNNDQTQRFPANAKTVVWNSARRPRISSLTQNVIYAEAFHSLIFNLQKHSRHRQKIREAATASVLTEGRA
jgi:hypothetical protein